MGWGLGVGSPVESMDSLATGSNLKSQYLAWTHFLIYIMRFKIRSLLIILKI